MGFTMGASLNSQGPYYGSFDFESLGILSSIYF